MQSITASFTQTRDYFVNIQWKANFESLRKKVDSVAKEGFEILKTLVFVGGPLLFFVKASVNPLAAGLALGLAFFDYTVPRTADMWEAMKQAPILDKAVIAGIAFLALKNVSIPVAAFAFGARLGGFIAQKADLSKKVHQWLQVIKHGDVPNPVREAVSASDR